VTSSYEPTVALETIERALRQLYSHAYAAEFGSDWVRRISTEKMRTAWQQREEDERRNRGRRGVASISTNPLDYANFYDLKTIAAAHWSPISAALGRERDALTFLERFDDLRNTVAHSRPLQIFEIELLSGIAGEVQNRVTIYMSQQNNDENIWPRITEVRDSFGNTLDGTATLTTNNPWVQTGLTIRVGDVVTFTCRATDQEGRTPLWRFTPHPANPADQQKLEESGTEVTFAWTVTEGNIGVGGGVQITLIGPGTHHRWPEGRDGFAGFWYRVLPQS
jgi:hypothetical protein